MLCGSSLEAEYCFRDVTCASIPSRYHLSCDRAMTDVKALPPKSRGIFPQERSLKPCRETRELACQGTLGHVTAGSVASDSLPGPRCCPPRGEAKSWGPTGSSQLLCQRYVIIPHLLSPDVSSSFHLQFPFST